MTDPKAAAALAQITKDANAATASVNRRFTEAQRRAMFGEIWDAEQRAKKEDRQRYPIPDPARPGYSGELADKQVEAQAEAVNTLEAKNWKQVQKKHGLSPDEHLAIVQEGSDKGWPTPLSP